MMFGVVLRMIGSKVVKQSGSNVDRLINAVLTEGLKDCNLAIFLFLYGFLVPPPPSISIERITLSPFGVQKGIIK